MSQKIFFFKKILYVIPSALVSFLPYYCHSFRIIVILSGLVSFLPNIVIPSELLPFQIFVILNSSSTLPYRKGEKNGHRRWPYMRVLYKMSIVFMAEMQYHNMCHYQPKFKSHKLHIFESFTFSFSDSEYVVCAKGQLISKADLKVFIRTKKPTKIFLYFGPSSLKWVKSKNKGKLLY